MDWQALIASFPNVTEISPGTAAYYRAMGIQAGVQAGASSNSIIRALQGQGLGIRRTQLLSTISQARDRFSTATTATQIPPGESAGTVLAGEAPAGWTGRYIHQVTATYRSIDEEGNYLLHTRTLGIVTRRALTAEEASAHAFDLMTQTPLGDEESPYPLSADILSLELTGVWYQTRMAA